MFAHIDADAFFASTLQRSHPEYLGKPLLALGMGGGCVIAASYEAKDKGVKTGMPLKEAQKLCPNAVAVPSDFTEACLASQEIESILENTCPLLEKFSVDEWTIDLKTLPGGVPKNLTEWSEDLRSDITNRTGLSVSCGVASSMLLAKMGSEYRKPAGTTVIQSIIDGRCVPLGRMSNDAISINNFLKDRPAAAIPGIGRKREAHAALLRWKTAHDVAYAPKHHIQKIFGKPGILFQKELCGVPINKISRIHIPPKSISRCRSFRATYDKALMKSHVFDHLTYAILKMRRQNLACKEIQVWLRDNQYKSSCARRPLPQPLSTGEDLIPFIQGALNDVLYKTPSCTQAGLTLGNLTPHSLQYSLFDPPKKLEGAQNVQKALDSLHTKYGWGSVYRAAAGMTGKTKRKTVTF